MSDIASLNNKMRDVISREINDTVERIKQNLVTNNQVVTRQTHDSVNAKIPRYNIGEIWALDHIDTLETGISPERSKMVSWVDTYRGLYSWYKNKGFTVQGQRDKRVAKATENQRTEGSLMYRNKTPKKVYSHEVQPMVERIEKELVGIVINTKILS
jgi:hypothetical protein